MGTSMGVRRFPLRWRGRRVWALLPWGVTRGRAWVELGGGRLRARFGPWRLETPLANLAEYRITGPYRWWRAIGLRRSVGNRDLTFGSSTDGGVCVCFREDVPFTLIRVPALTVTVDDVEAFARALNEAGIPGRDERTEGRP